MSYLMEKPMFQAKHLAGIAGIISAIPNDDRNTREFTAVHFAQELAKDNPQFDRARFIAACKGRPTMSRDNR